jgi:riboflavin kinase/FMN adenylyltransferase
MKVISLRPGSKLHLKKTCAAIGIFDGVHRGHQYLITEMLAAARRLKAQPIVITFFPHPAHVLRPDIKLGYLVSWQERLRRLKELGVKACLIVPFDRAFAKIGPEKFITDILVKKLDVKAIFVGEDFRFGKDRGGDAALFERLGPACGYEMHAVPALKQGGKVISSTRIRELISQGQLNKAAQLLGREVSVSGKVVKGARRGKGLGFPTANIAYESDILPPKGVYIVKLAIGPKEYPAIANLGTRPSFEDQVLRLHLEVFILDFSKNIYGKHVEVKFLKKIRSEKRFASVQALVRQIKKDEAVARKHFSK